MKTALCVATRPTVNPEFMHNALRIDGVRQYMLHATMPIAQARSVLATTALDNPEIETVVFLDDDIYFDVTDFHRLVALAAGLDVLAGVYPYKHPGAGMVVSWDGEPREIGFLHDGSLEEAVHVGMGFCAIRRHVLEKLSHSLERVETGRGSCFPFFAEMIGDGHWVGEDISFCRRVRAAGFKIFADTRIRLRHLGDYSYRPEDSIYATPTVAGFKVRPK